jgi:hypothetical protein
MKKARTMFTNLKVWSTFVALVCISSAPMTSRASAVTVEVAKKCDALTAKAFPPRVAGNPAAGSANGTPRAQLDYFKKCVANAGNIEEQPARESPPPNPHP